MSMKVIKKINNNCALCLDNKDHKVVAFGKGIGFKTPPYEIETHQIHRLYYDIDTEYVKMINDIPEDVFELSAKVIEYAKTKLDNLTNPNVVFTLADHINFAIKRYKENIDVKLPIINDIQYLYDIEMDIGNEALRLMREITNIHIPDEEAIYIALHIINAEIVNKSQRNKNFNEKIIDKIIDIIEDDLKIDIDKNGFNYSRFVTHLYYLLRRGKKNEFEENKNHNDMYLYLSSSLPKIYECSQKIGDYFSHHLHWKLTDEEYIYLILHISRLCNREGYTK